MANHIAIDFRAVKFAELGREFFAPQNQEQQEAVMRLNNAMRDLYAKCGAVELAIRSVDDALRAVAETFNSKIQEED